MVTLRASLPWFPWPPRDTLLDELVQRAADLDRPSGDRNRRRSAPYRGGVRFGGEPFRR